MAFSVEITSVMSRFTATCSLEPQTLLNDILNDDSDSPLICRNCEEISKAICRCKDCEVLLCNSCVVVHVQMQLTKDHCIIPLEGDIGSPSTSAYSSGSNLTSKGAHSNGSSPNSMYSNNSSLNCDLHLAETVRMFCDNCNVVFCKECNSLDHRTHSCIYFNDALERARNSSVKLISNAMKNGQGVKECIDLSLRMLDTLNLRSQSISREISNMMRRYRMAIEQRERELLTKLEGIRADKYRTIQQQIETFKTLFTSYSHSSNILSDALEVAGPLELIQIRDAISAELERLRCIRSNLPHVDDSITVIPPDNSVLLAISSMGDICTSNMPSAIGDERLRNLIYRPPPGYHQPNSRVTSYVEDLSSIGESFPLPESPEESFSKGSKFPTWTGHRSEEQSNVIALSTRMRYPIINGVNQSTNFIPHRNYTEAGTPVLIIGGEGESEGKFCRPWGVCCTPEGNIIVADRSNNRIQIFKPDGTFLRKFGSRGTDPGCFDRPAGVAVDPIGRIIVTDKDNHRVQVFSQEGIFQFKFGEKGSRICQFNYPWDLDVDSQGRIVVSDTRNHRIQLFDNNGIFIAKYGFENSSYMIKHFDSPRGVCFGKNGCVIVTDFNNHRLVVVDPNFSSAKFLGGEGCGEKQFLRPQGVVIDSAGNMIVADSRNNRIQIFEPNGSCLYEFGTLGKEPGQMDRPSGICLTPDGKIVVVDFGNNRIQVF